MPWAGAIAAASTPRGLIEQSGYLLGRMISRAARPTPTRPASLRLTHEGVGPSLASRRPRYPLVPSCRLHSHQPRRTGAPPEVTPRCWP